MTAIPLRCRQGHRDDHHLAVMPARLSANGRGASREAAMAQATIEIARGPRRTRAYPGASARALRGGLRTRSGAARRRARVVAAADAATRRSTAPSQARDAAGPAPR